MISNNETLESVVSGPRSKCVRVLGSRATLIALRYLVLYVLTC